MREPSVPFVDTLKSFFEAYRLTLNTQHSDKLVLTQQLKWWACSYLILFSVLFMGIPVASVVMFIFDCRSNNSCQITHFLSILMILLPFFLFGLLMTYSKLQRRVVVLDGTKDLCIQRTYTIFGIRTNTYALSELEALNIQKLRRRNRRYTYTVYQLVFHLHQYKTYRLAEMLTRPPLSRALVQIRAFLEQQDAAS